MSNTALVSIIMPLYNSERFVKESIDSVISQSYENWELIVVDDKSIDGSLPIVQSYVERDERVRLIALDHNNGPTKARNKAIEEAKGKYIAFLDSDDVWLVDKLQNQIDFMYQHKLVVTYCSYETMDEKSKYINTRPCVPYITYTEMLKSNQIGNLTGIYDVDFFGKVYMEEMAHEDYVLWLTLLKQIKFTRGYTEVLARYRIVSGSVSSNKLKVLKWQWNIYRNIEKLSFLKSSYYFVFYIYYALKKRS